MIFVERLMFKARMKLKSRVFFFLFHLSQDLVCACTYFINEGKISW